MPRRGVPPRPLAQHLGSCTAKCCIPKQSFLGQEGSLTFFATFMLKRILHHFAARVLTAGLSFAVVWLTARYLGAAGRGQVSLFVTDMSALVLLAGLVGGSSLIYLVPRRNVWHLLLPAYAWAGVVSGLGALLLGWWRPGGAAYAWHLGAVTLVQAWFSVNTFLLLGRQRERAYNVLMTVQALLLAGALALAFGPGQ